MLVEDLRSQALVLSIAVKHSVHTRQRLRGKGWNEGIVNKYCWLTINAATTRRKDQSDQRLEETVQQHIVCDPKQGRNVPFPSLDDCEKFQSPDSG